MKAEVSVALMEYPEEVANMFLANERAMSALQAARGRLGGATFTQARRDALAGAREALRIKRNQQYKGEASK